MTTKGLAARALCRWTARARMLLPVPFSPVISTGASVAATRAAMSSTPRMAGERLVISTSGASSASRRSSSATRLVRSRSVRSFSTWCRICAGVKGLAR